MLLFLSDGRTEVRARLYLMSKVNVAMAPMPVAAGTCIKDVRLAIHIASRTQF